MPIKIFENVTPKYWHLHTNSFAILNLLPFIIYEIKLVTLEQKHLALTLFCATFPDFCLHSCTCNTLFLTVNEFPGGT